MNALVQLGVSFAAVLLMAALAWWLKLGGDARIRTEDQARLLADQAVCGFKPVAVALDRAGIGALLKDGEGRQMLIRRNGANFVGRLLSSIVTTTPGPCTAMAPASIFRSKASRVAASGAGSFCPT